MADSVPKSFRAGELARLCGVSTDTLRHYERTGVLPLPKRTSAGYRQYPPDAVGRVRMVRHALTLGFSLSELARVLRARDKGGVPCREVRAIAEAKLRDLDRRVDEMLALRAHLRTLLAEWDERLQRTPEGQRARLLETLASGLVKERTGK